MINQRWYINTLVKHPYLVLLAISIFSCTCLVLPFTIKTMGLPDFQDPQAGFATRNTIISSRLTSWQNLQKELRPSGYLVKNPKQFLMEREMINATTPSYEAHLKRRGGRRKHSKKPKNRNVNQNEIEFDHKNETIYGKIITNEKNASVPEGPEITNKWQYLQNLSEYNSNIRPISYEKQFCGGPDERYAHLVIESTNKEDLFTWKNLQTLCKLENVLMNSKYVAELCISNSQMEGQCCKPWSLPNYIAVIFERHSCLGITESDVNKTKEILEECAKYFHQNELYVNCFRKKDCKVPLRCLKHDAVYNILNYLTSTSFFPSTKMDISKQKLQETILFLPIAASIASVPLYYEIEKMNQQFEDLSIVAIDFGIKSIIFDEYLFRDTWLMALGVIFIFICVWLYTTSLFLTVMTIIAVFFAVVISYFLYEVVYEISFFPFMNMLTIVICIGIGADNTFIFCKIWHVNKKDQSIDNDLGKIMSYTFHHAFKSMFVTTLTTAVAFLGSYASSVTAISCFSIFSGTAVIVNFLLTITWFPACLVIWEKTFLSNKIFSCYFLAFNQIACCFKSRWSLTPICCKCLDAIWKNKEDFVIKAVLKLRYFWIFAFTSLAVAGTILVFITPGLQLPSSIEFQLFQSNHPFEKYDFIYQHKFWFKKEQAGYNIEDYKMPLRFIWGVKPIDNGNHLNPSSLGTLQLDPNFDMADPASQVWLRNFCSNLRLQPFYQPIFGVSLTSCFIETFITSMERGCIDEFSRKDKSPCCSVSPFPFNRSVFNSCIMEEMAEIYNGPSRFTYPQSAGAIFSKEEAPIIKAIVVEFDSNTTFSISYEKIHEFYTKVNEWTNLQLLTAPESMQKGFFVSDLSFYDLQHELSRGTKVAIFVSVVLALGVLILSTLNPLISTLAVITISFSIITTMGGLILCGWTLNILESVAFSTSIGLSVDFSLHYCINYKMCPPNVGRNREDSTRYALSCLMGPSFMAGFTTALAGFFMIFSLILPYFQLGLFLVLIMAISWCYATFFLGSLLATIGPIQNCCQYSYRGWCCRSLRHKNEPTGRRNNEPIASTSSTTELDRVSFIKHDTPLPVKKKSSFREPFVRYTPNQGVADQSPSSNVTIIMADVMTEDN